MEIFGYVMYMWMGGSLVLVPSDGLMTLEQCKESIVIMQEKSFWGENSPGYRGVELVCMPVLTVK